MAKNFQLIAPAKTVSGANGKWTEEHAEEFEEAWEALMTNPGHHIRVEFENATERTAWFNAVKAYGLNRDNGVIFISKVKGSESDNPQTKHLVFTMEIGEDRDKRLQAAAQYKADLAARKAAGEVITRGRKAK